MTKWMISRYPSKCGPELLLFNICTHWNLYSTPNQFGLYPSEYNYVGPGKRPLSSITPTIIEKDNKLEIVIGGSGGSMIPTATLNVSIIPDF